MLLYDHTVRSWPFILREGFGLSCLVFRSCGCSPIDDKSRIFLFHFILFFVIDWSSIDNKHGNGKISLIKPPCMWTLLHSTILAIYPFRVSDWSLNWTQGSGKHKKKIHQEGSVCAGAHSHNRPTVLLELRSKICCFSIPVRKPRASGQRLASF